MKHLDDENLVRLADGELSENDAAAAREHATSCGVCRERIAAHERLVLAIAKPVPNSRDVAKLVDSVMDRIDRPSIASKPRSRAPLAIAGGLIALAASVALFAHFAETPSYLAARGGSDASIAHEIGASIVRVEGDTTRELGKNDADASANAVYAAVVRNAGARAAHALVFAVDAAGAVHWIAPVYLDAAADPVSIEIAPQTIDRIERPAVALEHPAAGRMRFVAVVSWKPMHVSEIEALPASELETARLATHFRDGEIYELGAVRVRMDLK